MQQYYVSFLGPVVYNAISIALRATGEDMVTSITPRQLMEGWELNILRYMNAMFTPFRAIGIPVPDMKEGYLGIQDHSFSVTRSVSYFELGPFEQYIKTEDGHTAGEVFQFDGQKYGLEKKC